MKISFYGLIFGSRTRVYFYILYNKKHLNRNPQNVLILYHFQIISKMEFLIIIWMVCLLLQKAVKTLML